MSGTKLKNVVKLKVAQKLDGEVWLLNSQSVDLSSSVVITMTVNFYDENRKDTDLTAIIFNPSRFEINDFTNELEGLEEQTEFSKVLSNIKGFYISTESDYLHETVKRFQKEYQENTQRTFYHVIISSDTEVINIVSDRLPQLVFEDEILESRIDTREEKIDAH